MDEQDGEEEIEGEQGDHDEENRRCRKSQEERTISEADEDEATQDVSFRTSSFDRVPSTEVPFGQRRACEPCHLAKVRTGLLETFGTETE